MRPERASAAGSDVVLEPSEKARPWASELATSVSNRGSRSRDTTGRFVLGRAGLNPSTGGQVLPVRFRMFSCLQARIAPRQRSCHPEAGGVLSRVLSAMGGWADGRMWGQNVTELFERGGPVMWPLLACSVLAVALIAERVMVYWSLRVAYGPLLAELESRVGDGTLDGLVDRLHESPRPLHRVVVAYLRYREAEKPLRDQVVLREASQQLARYDRRLNWLGILTHATPLLGLLGTVAGLVDAFHQIELKGGQVQPGDLASGIWSALLTTVCGLTIALPCLAARQGTHSRFRTSEHQSVPGSSTQ